MHAAIQNYMYIQKKISLGNQKHAMAIGIVHLVATLANWKISLYFILPPI